MIQDDELCTLCGREGHSASECPRGNSYRGVDPVPVLPSIPSDSEPLAPDDWDEFLVNMDA